MLEVPAALADSTKEFTGREWVFDAVDGWLADGGVRRLLIVGEAGTGKSTLAVRLVELATGAQDAGRWPRLGPGGLSAAHFCRARVDPTLDPYRVFAGLAQQLAARYTRFAEALAAVQEETGVSISLTGTATAETAAAGAELSGVRIGALNAAGLAAREVFDRFLRRPLEALCSETDEPVVLLIDSLDEAVTYGGGQTLVDVLRTATDDPGELPAQVRLLFTSRPDARATDGMGDATIDLIADAPADDHDVRDYAARRLGATGLPAGARAELADRIATEGKANFLYARYVLDDLIAHAERLDDPGSLELPAELSGHYREFLQRELAEGDQLREPYQLLLGALAVARGDGLTPAELGGALELRRPELDRALRAVEQYLSRSAGEGRLRLYHQSFRDFLLTGGVFDVYPGEVSDRLAAFFVAEHDGAWLACEDAYAVAFTPAHLVEALRAAEFRRDRERLAGALRDLLTDLGYLTARVRLGQGSTAALERDYREAAAAAPEEIAATLDAYSDAVRRESHVVLSRPGDLFVQLANRLGLAEPSGEAAPSGPWLRPLHPLPLERALRRTLSVHTETTEAVAVTPDGTYAASGSWDYTIGLWDVAGGRLVRRWPAATEGVEDVAISPDGTQLISRDFEDRVVLWDARSGTELRSWEAGAIAVTPDWGTLALARGDRVLELLRLPDGAPLRRWEAPGTVTVLAADGTRVAAAGPDPTTVWLLPLDGGDGVPVALEPAAGERAFASGLVAPALSEDGAVLVAGDRDGRLSAYSLAERRLLWSRRADANAVNAVAVSAKQGLAFAGGVAGTVGVYDLAGGEQVTRLRGHTGQVMRLALTGDGATLVSAGGEGAVRVWDVRACRTAAPEKGHAAEVTALALSGDMRLAASGAADGSLMVWDAGTGEVVAATAAHAARVGGVAFLPDGRLVSAGADGVVRVCDPDAAADPLAAIEVPEADDAWAEGLQSLAALDAARVLAGAADGRLLTVDLASREVTVLGTAGEMGVAGLAAARDRATVVSANTDGAVRRWWLEDGRGARSLAEVSEARTVTLAPDERHALVGDLDGVISILPLEPGEPRGALTGHVNYVDALAVTEDGLVISGGWDATLRIWDLAARREVGRYTWELPLSRAVAGRADGRDVIVAGDRQGGVLFLTVESP